MISGKETHGTESKEEDAQFVNAIFRLRKDNDERKQRNENDVSKASTG